MNIVEVNLEALEQAITLVVGAQLREAIRVTYFALNTAEERGEIEARSAALAYIEKERADARAGGRNTGYDEGYKDGLADGAGIERDDTVKIDAWREGADWRDVIIDDAVAATSDDYVALNRAKFDHDAEGQEG